ncbi:MAG TPA: hypothetical protein VMG13_00200, partial [Trebonia sp.]|nr:hypothetical protein [Trebonia sp.]
TATAFAVAAGELTRRGEPALALRVLDLGLLSHPDAADLAGLRRGVLYGLAEREQLINPFKFAYYAGLLDLDLPSPG